MLTSTTDHFTPVQLKQISHFNSVTEEWRKSSTLWRDKVWSKFSNNKLEAQFAIYLTDQKSKIAMITIPYTLWLPSCNFHKLLVAWRQPVAINHFCHIHSSYLIHYTTLTLSSRLHRPYSLRVHTLSSLDQNMNHVFLSYYRYRYHFLNDKTSDTEPIHTRIEQVLLVWFAKLAEFSQSLCQ